MCISLEDIDEVLLDLGEQVDPLHAVSLVSKQISIIDLDVGGEE